MPITATCVAIAPEKFGTYYGYGQGAGTFQRGQYLYIVCSNPAYNQTITSGVPPAVLAQARVLKSSDQGATWFEVDESNGPTVSLASGTANGRTSPMTACYIDANTLLVGYFVWDYVFGHPVELRFSTFDLITETWGAETSGGPTSLTVSNLAVAYRASDGAAIFTYDGLQTVSASARGRVYYVVYNAGWGAETPIDAAQTGSTENWNFAGVVSGDGNRTHLFYQQSTRPQVVGVINLFQVTLTSGDVLIAPVLITDTVTFSTDAPWSRAANRVVSGVTSIYIGYVKQADHLLYFSGAASADSPVFAEQLIGGISQCITAGLFSAGFGVSNGLVGATKQSTGASAVVTGSHDLTTWDAMTPANIPSVPIPFPAQQVRSWTGLGIDINGVFPTAGIVINSIEFPPG